MPASWTPTASAGGPSHGGAPSSGGGLAAVLLGQGGGAEARRRQTAPAPAPAPAAPAGGPGEKLAEERARAKRILDAKREAEKEEQRAKNKQFTVELGDVGTGESLAAIIKKQQAKEEADEAGGAGAGSATALDRWQMRQFNVGWTDIVRGANERPLQPARGHEAEDVYRKPGWWGAGLCGTACYENDDLDVHLGSSLLTFALAAALPWYVLAQNTSAIREEKRVSHRFVAEFATSHKLGLGGLVQACMCSACVPLNWVHCCVPLLPFSPCLMYAAVRQRRALMKKYGMKTMSPCFEIYCKGLCYPCAIAQHAVFLREQRAAIKKANTWQKRQGLQRLLRNTQNPGAHIIFTDRDIKVDFYGNEIAQNNAEAALKAASRKEMEALHSLSKEEREAEEARREADAAANAAAIADLEALEAVKAADEVSKVKDGALSFMEAMSSGSVKADKDAPMTEDEAARLIQRCIKRRRARKAIEAKAEEGKKAMEHAEKLAAEAAEAEKRAEKEEREAVEARQALEDARSHRDLLLKDAKARRKAKKRASRVKAKKQVRRQSMMQRLTFGRFGSDIVEEFTDDEETSSDEEDEEDAIVPLKHGSASSLWHTVTLAEHTARVTSVLFCSHKLVTASNDRSVRIWCKYKSAAEDHETGIRVMSRLWETEAVIKMDEMATGLCKIRMRPFGEALQDVLFVSTSDNCFHAYISEAIGETLPAWSRVATVRLGSSVLCMTEHKAVRPPILASYLLVGMEDGAIHFFDMTKPGALESMQESRVEYPRPDGTLTGHFGSIVSLCSINTTAFASGSSDGSVRVWQERDIKHLLREKDFDADGNVVEEFKYVFYAETKQVFAGHGVVEGAAWAMQRDSSTRFVIGDDRSLRAFEAAAEGEPFEAQGVQENAHDAAFTALTRVGPYFVSASQDGSVKLWDRTTLSLRKPIEVHDGPVWDVLADVEGTQVVSAGTDQLVHICEPSKPDMSMDENDRARNRTVPARRRKAAVVHGILRPEAEMAALDIQRIWRGVRDRSNFLVLFKEKQAEIAKQEAKLKKREELKLKHPGTMERLEKLGLL